LDGWLLDVTDSDDGTAVDLWVKDRGGRVTARRVPYRPPFLVGGTKGALERLRQNLLEHRHAASVTLVRERPTHYDRRPRTLLSIVPWSNRARLPLAKHIDALGGYREHTLYDVDLGAPQRYYLATGLYPFAPVREGPDGYEATEPPEKVEYELPPLTIAPFEIRLQGHRRGGPIPRDPRLASVKLGAAILEGDEAALLAELGAELDRQDPDILLTDGGDAFDIPWIYRRAGALGLSPEEFHLSRVPRAFRPDRAGRSFVTYGRVLHRAASYLLNGRFHIDRENSFLFDDVALAGAVDAARLSRLSLSTVSRQSPGTAFTAMEIATALTEGIHVPWKKNRPEEFKSARTLVTADRGGAILLPPVGVFDGIDEFDFASLYPQIMVRYNLSAETLGCPCCPESPVVAPGLLYRSCVRKVGLLPRTLKPLLDRRTHFKEAMRDPSATPERRESLKRRAKMLKWILVTAFGYQGYRNARFGRIEVHEAINAYAREVLATLMARAEGVGYRVVHGIVDSLWLAPGDPGHPPDAPAFAEEMGRSLGLPLSYEGRYDWIVFLPSVGTGFGVPNRYYGRYGSGEFKLRGIGSRRNDTPGLLRQYEGEVLEILGESKDAAGVRARVPAVLERTDRFAERLRGGGWPVEELLLTHRLSQAPESYTVYTDTVAALRQLHDVGLERAPGESVRYVVLDRKARAYRDRVRAAELLEEGGRYDAEAYLELLARAAETLLAPLGVDRTDVRDRWPAPVGDRKPRYRSGERPGQRRLDEADGVEAGVGTFRGTAA
jgi:DNA polymerase elongation subunit (family B)